LKILSVLKRSIALLDRGLAVIGIEGRDRRVTVRRRGRFIQIDVPLTATGTALVLNSEGLCPWRSEENREQCGG
jgi:hypothetical protein